VRDLAAPVPESVGVLSVYSRTDGVVDWRACVDPAGRALEVATSHCGMAAHAPTLWAVSDAISDFAAG
jgi:triacylglycerol lipase